MPLLPLPDAGLRRLAMLPAVAVLLLAGLAQAQDDSFKLHEKHIERVENAQKIGMLSVDAFGDQISHFSGALSFNNVDVSIPGNSGLPVELRRAFAIEDRREFNNGPSPKSHLGGFAEWDLDIYHLSGTFRESSGWTVSGPNPNARCTNATQPPSYPIFADHEYWSGYHFNAPGGGGGLMLKAQSGEMPHPTAGGPFPWTTKSNWRFSCLPSTTNGYPGEAFLAHAPDGTKVYLDHVIVRDAPALKGGGTYTQPVFGTMQRDTVFFVVSRVEDRFGNWVSYNYVGNELRSITASDGRQITLTWSGGRIASVTSALGTWTYAYANNQLVAVTRPDASQWLYSKVGRLRMITSPSPVLEDPLAECDSPEAAGSENITYTVTHPGGAVAAFKVGALRQVRHYVPRFCVRETETYRYYQIPNVIDSLGVFEKKITGPGLPEMKWNYSYSGGNELAWEDFCQNGTIFGGLGSAGSFGFDLQAICDQPRVVTITGPNGTYAREEYGIRYGVNEGQLLKREVGSGPANNLETTTYTYADEADAANQPYPLEAGQRLVMYSDPMSSQLRPQKQVTINRQGHNFSRSYAAFDAFARPTALTRFSDLPLTFITRDETITYADRLDLWVIGQVSRQVVAGVEVERTEFTAQALPWRLYDHGLLVQTLGYNADGTVASVTDGRNNMTTLANWHRGVPQLVTFPDATTLQATVDNRGWVTSVTNEVGSTNTYLYDSMGRVSRVSYPTGDVVAWMPTDFSFTRSGSAAFGLPAGHWQHSTTRGNYRKTVYYDALWRPVLEREWDQGNVTGTQRYRGRAYDHANRVTFEGYPRSTATSLSSFTAGVTTTYDALGRVTRVEQDSELGELVTTTEYLTGLKTRVTNPRGFSTLTAYRTFDDPSSAKPYNIQSGGVTTWMWLDLFDKTTAMFRSGTYEGQTVTTSRYYAYDAQQRLCKRVELEGGTTYFDYDAAGNVAWTADGQPQAEHSWAIASVCDREAVPASERTVRSYDSRNRLTLVDYPDATPDVATFYFPDGLVQRISSGDVNLHYNYNKRRMLAYEELRWDQGQGSWPISHEYTPGGDYSRFVYWPTAHTIDYAPNALGQATRAGSYATNAKYHPNGALAEFTYGNGIVHTMTQNLRQLPERSLDMFGASAVIDDSYDYDANGNVVAISDGLPGQPGNRDMSYDALDRLIGVVAGSAQGGNGTFAYDPLDNLRVMDQGSRQFRYAYDANNRLTQITSPAGTLLHTFGYDVRGNTTSKDAAVLSFNRANRLTQSTLGSPASYVYDGLGRRVLEASAGAGTYFHYTRDGKLVFTADYKTGMWINHVYLAGSLVADRKLPVSGGAEQVTYQHTDALGTPVAFTDAAGNVTRRERMTAWGEPSDGAWTNGPGYTGHQMDAGSKLIYMQQRYYDPAIGRFYSNDPITADARFGSNFSRYWYANNNPYRYVDPDGRYGRGNGFKNDEWKAFDKAQRRAAGALRRKAMSFREAASADSSDKSAKSVRDDFSSHFGAEASAENLNAVADRLDEMAGALEDKQNFMANAVSAERMAELGGTVNSMAGVFSDNRQVVYVNVKHAEFGVTQTLARGVAHEAAHSIGLGHGLVGGKAAYFQGSADERAAYEALSKVDPSAAMTNPDHLVNSAGVK